MGTFFENTGWFADLTRSVQKRNVVTVDPFEGLISTMSDLQHVCMRLRGEVDELKVQKSDLQRQLRTGSVTGQVNNKYVQELEDKVRDLETQQRRWVDDARVIIDAQKEKKELQGRLAAMQRDLDVIQVESARLYGMEQRMETATKEAEVLRGELSQLRLVHERAAADLKKLEDENGLLIESTLVAKKTEADRMNEIFDLEKKIKDLTEKLQEKVLAAGVVAMGDLDEPAADGDSRGGVDATRLSQRFTTQMEPRVVTQPPSKLGRRLERCHLHDVDAVAVSPQGTTFVSGGSDKVVKVWDSKSFEEKAQLRSAVSGILRLQFNATGDVLVGATSDGSAVVWNTGSHRHMFSLCGHNAKITGVCFGDDKTLLTSGADRTIRRWDLMRNGACTNTTMCWSNCTDLASGGSAVVASAHYDGGLRFWDARTVNSVEELKNAHSQALTSVCFSGCGNRVLSTAKDGTVKMWDIRNYTELFKLDLKHFTGILSTHKACMSPDDTFLAVGILTDGPSGVVQIYDTRSRPKLRSTLSGGHVGQISQVEWMPDGSFLLSAGTDGAISAWTS